MINHKSEGRHLVVPQFPDPKGLPQGRERNQGLNSTVKLVNAEN